jgi:hypothetical protein
MGIGWNESAEVDSRQSKKSPEKRELILVTGPIPMLDSRQVLKNFALVVDGT